MLLISVMLLLVMQTVFRTKKKRIYIRDFIHYLTIHYFLKASFEIQVAIYKFNILNRLLLLLETENNKIFKC